VAILCQHPSPEDDKYEKLFGQLRTGIVLFGVSTADGPKECVLLVDRDGDSAVRSGTEIYSGRRFDTIPRKREMIWLG
jgi:hypothetical protein